MVRRLLCSHCLIARGGAFTAPAPARNAGGQGVPGKTAGSETGGPTKQIRRMRPRKRCPYCRCLYQPDPRVGSRQWSCTKPECQQQRRREAQRRYREKHPDEAAARHIRKALAAAKAGIAVPAPTGPPGRVSRFPWEELRDEISPQAFVIVSFFVRLVVGLAKDERLAQVDGNTHQDAQLVG